MTVAAGLWIAAAALVAFAVGKAIRIADERANRPDPWLINPDSACWTADMHTDNVED